MSVSTSLRSPSMPASAWPARRRPFEGERPGDDADRQRTEGPGDAGDDGGAAGPGAAALAGGDEDHVGALEDLLDLLPVVFGGVASHFGVGPGTEAAGQLPADVELDVGVAHQQRLGVGVDGDELDALQTDLDHSVYGIDTAAANADDLDNCQVVLWRGHPAGPLRVVFVVFCLAHPACAGLVRCTCPLQRCAPGVSGHARTHPGGSCTAGKNLRSLTLTLDYRLRVMSTRGWDGL